ncbi:heat shock protein 70kD, peptide-binding domain-containing protein, partial [Flammula alnicola]
NVNPLRIGIVKADGFVSTVMEKFLSLPHRKTVIFTTSKEHQSTATIKVVAGVTPKAADNTVIAEVLKGLTPLPKGVPRIKITFDVEQMGRTQIVAEE